MKEKLYNMIPIFILIIASIFSLQFFVDLAPVEDEIIVTYEPSLLGYWSFDENEGSSITERTGHFDETSLSYIFNDAVYREDSDPQWRNSGVKDGSLLFDGFTTHFSYEEYSIPDDSFTMSVWIAPRAFSVGYEGKLSSFISNYRESSNTNNEIVFDSGFDFGMFRHGSWAFKMMLENQTETVSEYIEIWDEGHALDKYEWNHVMVSFDSETGRVSLYKNGELANEVFSSNPNMRLKQSVEDLFIGKNAQSFYIAGNDTNAFMGQMDELRIYGDALTNDKALEFYERYVFENESIHPEVVMDDLMWDDSGFETDRFRPQYHAVPVQSWMNEPHAPVYYNGKYHLFYQFNPFGPYFGQHHWGHWVSDDMIHWEHEKPALAPFLTDNGFSMDAIWSGGATLDENGDPVLFYTAGPSQTIGAARPHDLSDPYLKDWDMYPDIVVNSDTLPPGWNRPDFRDPYVWYNEEINEWYMLLTAGYYDEGMGKNRGTSAVYSSTNLRDWTFRGPILSPDSYVHEPRFGSSWELTVLLPLNNEAGEHVKDIYMFLPHGGGSRIEVFYYIGEFNEQTYQFEPDHTVARKLDYGDGIFTGPSGFVDPLTGRSIVMSIAQSDRDAGSNFASGWAHNAGMPIHLYLDSDGELAIEPIEEIESARSETLYELDEELEVGLLELNELNEELSSIQSDLLEVEFTISNQTANNIYFSLRKSADGENETKIGYDFIEEAAYVDILRSSNNPRGALSLSYSDAPITVNDDGTITFRIFLDRSIIETYINNEVSITKRIYPDLADALGVEIHSDGYFTLHDLVIYQMSNVYGETASPYYGE